MIEKHSHPHSHENLSVARLANHIARYHKGDEFEFEVDEEHDHSSKRKVNWNHAAHISISPAQVAAMAHAEVVFFGIEGCLKQSSMWSAIRRSGAMASACSVPSVSLWGASELPMFVEAFLKGKIVVIVPDADWKKEAGKIQHVENHSRVFQGRLLNLGVETVHIAAPPLDPSGKPIACWNPWAGKADKLKGVDDFLGMGNGLLHELVCIDYDPPAGIDRWMITNGNHFQRQYRIKLGRILRQLSVFSGSSGEISLPYVTLANVMDIRHQRMSEAIRDLESIGAIEVIGGGDLSAQNRMFGLDWAVDRPRIILKEELRSVDRGFPSLGELLGEKLLGQPVRCRPEAGFNDLSPDSLV